MGFQFKSNSDGVEQVVNDRKNAINELLDAALWPSKPPDLLQLDGTHVQILIFCLRLSIIMSMEG